MVVFLSLSSAILNITIKYIWLDKHCITLIKSEHPWAVHLCRIIWRFCCITSRILILSLIWAVFGVIVFALFLLFSFLLWQCSRVGIKAFSHSICGLFRDWFSGVDVIPKRLRLSVLFHCIPIVLAVVFSELTYFWIHHMFESMLAMIFITVFVAEDVPSLDHKCFWCRQRFDFALGAIIITWCIMVVECACWVGLKFWMKVFKENTYQITFELFMNSLEVKELEDSDQFDFNATKFGMGVSEPTNKDFDEDEDEDDDEDQENKIKKERVTVTPGMDDGEKNDDESWGHYRGDTDTKVDLKQMEFVVDQVMNAEFMKQSSM